MSNCTHHCDTCQENCNSRARVSEKAPLGELSSVKRVYAVVSGKGGVGKSMVTALLATMAQRRGLRTAILDADMTGPSIPRAFGLKERIEQGPDGFFPVRTKTGIEVMSVNLMLERPDQPLVWRGPLLADLAVQFWSNTVWDDLDVMFIDCPPGTGDVPLTVLQKLPVDGVIMVTSPQELVSMIVEKAFVLCDKLNVPIKGLVENYSYYICPHCDAKHTVYGESHVEELAAAHGIDAVARLPFNPKLAGAADRGMTELFEGEWLDELCEKLLEGLE